MKEIQHDTALEYFQMGEIEFQPVC